MHVLWIMLSKTRALNISNVETWVVNHGHFVDGDYLEM